MYFSSFSELLYMDGHGSYVWIAYASTLLVLAANFVAIRWSTKSQERALRWRHEAQTLKQQLSNETSE
ncbi:MAG: heme exporter protein CcmD [Pseudomonadota bacterium]|nr:heme exporter protein CcmD [Pseudomonadota bacterium]